MRNVLNKIPTEPGVQFHCKGDRSLVFRVCPFESANDDFSNTDTIRMGVSIICFKGSQIDFPNRYVLQSLKIAYIIANSADPDGMHITKLPF